jgi:hypothetical protein
VLRLGAEKLCPCAIGPFEPMRRMVEEISIDPSKKDTGFL